MAEARSQTVILWVGDDTGSSLILKSLKARFTANFLHILVRCAVAATVVLFVIVAVVVVLLRDLLIFVNAPSQTVLSSLPSS